MSIDHDDARLTAYVLGELDDAERAAFEAELESSAELRRAVDETRQTVGALAGALGAEPTFLLSDEQRAAVLGAATSGDSARQVEVAGGAQGQAPVGQRRVLWSLAMAASLLIACGVGYVVGAGSLGGRELARSSTGPQMLNNSRSLEQVYPVADGAIDVSKFAANENKGNGEFNDEAPREGTLGLDTLGLSADLDIPFKDFNGTAMGGMPFSFDGRALVAESRPAGAPATAEQLSQATEGKYFVFDNSGSMVVPRSRAAPAPNASLPGRGGARRPPSNSPDATWGIGGGGRLTILGGGTLEVNGTSARPIHGLPGGGGAQTDFESLSELITKALAGSQPAPVGVREVEVLEGVAIPFPADVPIAYPDTKFWQELTNRRGKFLVTDLGSTTQTSSGVTLRGVIINGDDLEAEGVRFTLGVGTNGDPGFESLGGVRVKREVLPRVPADGDDDGRGPGQGGDNYAPIVENPFRVVRVEPRSTFSIDVDTASYAKTRMFLMQHDALPPPDAVRIEELVNYFSYDYAPPEGDVPFAARVEVAACPWRPESRLVRVAIKGREIERDKRPMSNLVFLLDVSGSMNQPNKLPLVKRGMAMLVGELGENDRVAIVVYAGAAGMVLDSTTGDQQKTILDSLERLQAGGSTNGGEGIRRAYQIALDHFIKGGTNRVILCTDGDFNVGTTSSGELVELAAKNAASGVFLSVLGFGIGNHNDSMLEQISNRGNGNYAFIDTEAEAHKVMVDEIGGTLVTIAKDVKIQIEFNPAEVAAYRLIGYENRMLATQDFNDDKKDAGEIGAGHTVTALYEVVPTAAKETVDVPKTDELKYQVGPGLTEAATSGELLTLKLRYKDPEADVSKLLSFPIKDDGQSFSAASKDFQFAASVASFGMLLRGSKYAGNTTYDAVLEIAGGSSSDDPHGYRAEFLEMVKQAKTLSGK